MKKLLIFVLALSLTFSTTGCIITSQKESATEEKTTAEKTTEEDTTEENTTEEDTTEEVTTEEETTEEETTKKAETLEEFYGTEEYQEYLESQREYILSIYSSMYSDIQFVIEGNTFAYEYTYANEYDVESTAATLEKTLTDDYFISTVEAMEEESGISGITLEFAYYNPDGTEIFRKSFTK